MPGLCDLAHRPSQEVRITVFYSFFHPDVLPSHKSVNVLVSERPLHQKTGFFVSLACLHLMLLEATPEHKAFPGWDSYKLVGCEQHLLDTNPNT